MRLSPRVAKIEIGRGNMRLKQRVKELEEKADLWIPRIRDNSNAIRKLRRQLECQHENARFIELDYWPIDNAPYKKICADCGLMLESYDSREDWLKAKAKWMRAEAARLEKEAQNENRSAAAN